jgi:fission 1 protein
MKRKANTSAYRPHSTSHGCVPTAGSPRTLDANRPPQGLIKSNERADQQTGVRLLSQIFRTSPERRRECLYYLALGHYKLGSYSEARRYNDLLLDKEPANMQAGSLRSLIDDKVAKEGLMGVAILSGVAIAAGVVGGILFRGFARKR